MCGENASHSDDRATEIQCYEKAPAGLIDLSLQTSAWGWYYLVKILWAVYCCD